MLASPYFDNPKTASPSLLQASDCENLLASAEKVIREGLKVANLDVCPSICLILGSGLGGLAECIDSATVIPYREIPGFPLSRVVGHAGNLVIGKFYGRPVMALAGRAHLYEGWSHFEATFPIRVLQRLGGKRLVVSNASGGINPRFRSGQVVLIDQHIDWFGKRGRATGSQPTGMESPARHDCPVYDPDWIERARESALRLGFQLERGTYLATTGPSYETRAEYRAFARMGADMVGMSTVHEVMLASRLGMKCTAFSIVTNVAIPDLPTRTEHADVLDWSRQAQSQLIPLLKQLVSTVE